MPIYEYRCDDCRETFERMRSFADRDRPAACPTCESLRSSVMVSSFAAIGPTEFTSTLPIAPRAGGGCCGGSCGCGH